MWRLWWLRWWRLILELCDEVGFAQLCLVELCLDAGVLTLCKPMLGFRLGVRIGGSCEGYRA